MHSRDIGSQLGSEGYPTHFWYPLRYWSNPPTQIKVWCEEKEGFARDWWFLWMVLPCSLCLEIVYSLALPVLGNGRMMGFQSSPIRYQSLPWHLKNNFHNLSRRTKTIARWGGRPMHEIANRTDHSKPPHAINYPSIASGMKRRPPCLL